jgi:hypothetical protein
MKNQDRKLWPYKSRTALTFSILILIVSLIAFVILRTALSWPSKDLEKTVLLGIFIISLIPIVLMVADTIMERGAVVEYKGVKIDFSQVQRTAISGITIPANIGVPGQAVPDSSSTKILDTLRQAASSDVVLIDLEEGQAWWETRLLVLLSGAVRLSRPNTFVFVGKDGGVDKYFQGWGSASDLLPLLLKAHPKYYPIYYSVLAVVLQWEFVEPQEPNTQPQLPVWMQPLGVLPGLAGTRSWMAFDIATGLPNMFFAEQLLASELGSQVEEVEPPKISLVRLEELFRPVLHKEVIDETWPSERQLGNFFNNDLEFMAITHNGQFKSLISRIDVLNAMVGSLVQNK